MSTRKLLLMSSSNLHGFAYLEHAKDVLSDFFKRHKVEQILFIPYAICDHDHYIRKIAEPITKWGFKIESIHDKPGGELKAVNEAQLIYIGGGNTFLLLKTLYEKNLVEAIRKRVLSEGVPYVGSSAGTNVATRSIKTTNDMPIVYPPSFDALGLVPFNINPHYQDPEVTTKHKGETREQRIMEFHELNEHAVVGLREGSALLVEGDRVTLLGGENSARIFRKGQQPFEYPVNSDLSFLLNKV